MSFKIEKILVGRLKKAATGQYAPTMTAIVERGIELALKELEEKK